MLALYLGHPACRCGYLVQDCTTPRAGLPPCIEMTDSYLLLKCSKMPDFASRCSFLTSVVRLNLSLDWQYTSRGACSNKAPESSFEITCFAFILTSTRLCIAYEALSRVGLLHVCLKMIFLSHYIAIISSLQEWTERCTSNMNLLSDQEDCTCFLLPQPELYTTRTGYQIVPIRQALLPEPPLELLVYPSQKQTFLISRQSCPAEQSNHSVPPDDALPQHSCPVRPCPPYKTDPPPYNPVSSHAEIKFRRQPESVTAMYPIKRTRPKTERVQNVLRIRFGA